MDIYSHCHRAVAELGVLFVLDHQALSKTVKNILDLLIVKPDELALGNAHQVFAER